MISTEGEGGDELRHMSLRLENFLKSAKSKHRGEVHLVCLWGGTNDFRLGAASDDVIENGLTPCLRICQEYNCLVVLLTVLEMSFENVGHGNISANRKAFNDRLLRGDFVGGELSNLIVASVDVSSQIPLLSLPPSAREKWYCDGLHLTRKGYDKVASLTAEAIRASINLKTCKPRKNKATSTTTPPLPPPSAPPRTSSNPPRVNTGAKCTSYVCGR